MKIVISSPRSFLISFIQIFLFHSATNLLKEEEPKLIIFFLLNKIINFLEKEKFNHLVHVAISAK